MTTNETIVKMIFDRWYGSVKNWDTMLDSLSDEQMQQEVSPGKNRGIYLLGHLIAVHDDMSVLIGTGEKLYPELTEPFIKSPDKKYADILSVAELRTMWKNQCAVLKEKFDAMQTDAWFEKHTAVTEEDFLKEPNRNKLNIILTRTTHLAYHTGQLVLFTQKGE